MKRVKAILKYAGIIVVLGIALLLIVNAWFVHSTGKTLGLKLSALHEAGDPVRLADLAPPSNSPEHNAATNLAMIADDLEKLSESLHTEVFRRYREGDSLTKEDRDRIAVLFSQYPNVLPHLEKASSSQLCEWSDLDYSLSTAEFGEAQFQKLRDMRSAFRVLRAHNMWLIANGETDKALENTLNTLRLSRLTMQDRLMVMYLTAIACEGIAIADVEAVLTVGELPAASREALDAELALHDSLTNYSQMLKNERGFALTAVDEFPASNWWLRRGFTNQGKIDFINYYDRQIANAHLVYSKYVAKEETAVLGETSFSIHTALIQLLRGANNQARIATCSFIARVRALRVLNAIQARSLTENESIALSDLGLPDAATIDPFNGLPLIVKKLPEGWLVYSVGRNLVDDGGKLENREDDGVGVPVTTKVTNGAQNAVPGKAP